jgi:serralysin
MATVTELNTTITSGINYIDALLDEGPDWNFLTSGGNVLRYTFSTASGNEAGKTGQEGFTASQQAYARTAINELQRITGIQFLETSDGTAAQLHLCNFNIPASNTTGLCSWRTSFSYGTDGDLIKYDADAYVYLDNVEWYAQNRNLAPGGQGYETLLHELGHALGLKHPFEGDIHLPAAEDTTANTLMSYTERGGPYTTYSQYDIAALNWIYGGDGLKGALGNSSATGGRYITGTSAADTLTGTRYDDTLEGDGGNDMIYGGEGSDTIVLRGLRSDYTFTQLANGDLRVSSAIDGTDNVSSIEVLHFADGSYERAQIGLDTTPPAAPELAVTKNAAGFARGSTPLVTGKAEANSTVKVYSGTTEIGSTTVDASGVWTVITKPFADGMNYSLYAKATDAAGNTSSASATVSFNVDAHAPSTPAGNLTMTSENQGTFSGSAEAGTLIQLVRVPQGIEIAHTTVGTDGKWSINSSPLPNGAYTVGVVAVDKADNATSAASSLKFTVSSNLNLTGSAANDTLTAPGAGNNAIDGQGGLDVAVYNGARANFSIAKDVWGFTINDNTGATGRDSLIDVERVHFSNAWVALDIDGVAGQVFRLYQAVYDRPAEATGMGYWLWRMDNGSAFNQVALEFTKQPEFDKNYGTNPSDAEFVAKLYQNVLHRPAEGAGYDYWLDVLSNKHVAREQVLTDFSESPENKVQVIGSIQNGIEYTPWMG